MSWQRNFLALMRMCVNAIFSCLSRIGLETDWGEGSLIGNEKLNSYIENLIPERNELLSEMENYAKQNHIPIMELPGIEAMLQILRIQKPKRILEVGTAIGYSALRIVTAIDDVKVVTIERDIERCQLAETYFERSGQKDQIVLIKGDALEVEDQVQKLGPFDTIFIDAAKGQYQRFFERYSKYLQPEGIVIIDNVLYEGFVYEPEVIRTRRTRCSVKKIVQFNRWLMSHPDYDTAIIPVGDGVAISKKRGESQ